MDKHDFRKYAHRVADWMADYYENIEAYPVRSQVKPGEIISQLPDLPPPKPENMETILDDVDKIIMPGITHWQNPNFFAYFPANTSYPSILAEMMTSALGSQCMVWETSPAAAELEEKVMSWLKKMTGIPETFEGVIQDTASTSTLVAVLSAREKKSKNSVNNAGFTGNLYRVYCSTEAHSSVEKAVKIAGIGRQNLRKIEVDENLSMKAEMLEETILSDIQEGFIPLCVVAALGTTGTAAMDPLMDISEICRKNDVWLHVDAAYAGSAFVLEEQRYLLKGIENADSYVFNPHKWMFTNFDCSAFFVKDREQLISTFEILPEYLKTRPDSQVNNYRDWGIQLGRRFRALKLWFVIREMGVEGIKQKIANHIKWANELAGEIRKTPGFELLEPQNLALVCFSLSKKSGVSMEDHNARTMDFLHRLNSSGKVYLSHTKVNEKVFLRMQIGQTSVTEKHVRDAWNFIKSESQIKI